MSLAFSVPAGWHLVEQCSFDPTIAEFIASFGCENAYESG